MSDLEQRMRDIQDFGEQGGVVPVVDVAATSTFLNPHDMERTFRGELAGCYLYSRHSNPTVAAFSKKLAAMEGMEAAIGLASGMAAVACSLAQLLGAGDHIVASNVVYGGTYALLHNFFKKRGSEVSWVDPTQVAEFERARKPNTKVFYTETMSNPLLSISPIRSLAALSRKLGVQLVVDNTFCPCVVSAGAMGADVVIYSATKYLSGASDMIAGAIVSSRAMIDSLVDINAGSIMLTGPVMDPRVAHELYLRLDHLPIRMRAHADAALKLALQMKDQGMQVIYPGLESHPNHSLFKSMANPEFGFGGMITLDCGTQENAFKLAARLQDDRFGLYAVSLGLSRTLMSVPSVTTSSEIPEEIQKQTGLSASLLRLSIGFTGNQEELSRRFFKAAKECLS